MFVLWPMPPSTLHPPPSPTHPTFLPPQRHHTPCMTAPKNTLSLDLFPCPLFSFFKASVHTGLREAGSKPRPQPCPHEPCRVFSVEGLSQANAYHYTLPLSHQLLSFTNYLLGHRGDSLCSLVSLNGQGLVRVKGSIPCVAHWLPGLGVVFSVLLIGCQG